jgi:hypothetical protein
MVDNVPVKIAGFEYIGPELSFRVNKEIWRESDKRGMPIRWTSPKPENYISFIDQGTVFLFMEIERVPYLNEKENVDIIKFIAIPPNDESILDPIELTIEELNNMVNEGLLGFKDPKDVQYLVISPSGSLIRDYQTWTYNHPVYMPNEIYIVMGVNEYRNSRGKLGVGQKIPLREFIDAYSMAVGSDAIMRQ